jgi:hypothetical protein
MSLSPIRIAIGVAFLALTSCATLDFVHDPHSGPISREQVPALLKSIRCELITYYELNRQNRRLFFAEANRTLAVENYPHYELSEKLFGLITLDLKVQDMLSASGAFDNLKTFDAAHSQTWHFGPSLSDQNTYELNWSFLIAQNNRLVALSNSTDPFQCYSSIPILNADTRQNVSKGRGYASLKDFGGLARGAYPEFQLFTRILVNGITPLAAWIQSNTVETWNNFVAKSRDVETNEQIIPAQMTYTFTVQVSGGLDVKFTLVSPVWSALAPELSGSTQQTGSLAIILNGEAAALASSAPAGGAQIVSAAGTVTIPVPPGAPAATSLPSSQAKQGRVLYPLPLIPPPPFSLPRR